jgi:putative glutamine amidotransferase
VVASQPMRMGRVSPTSRPLIGITIGPESKDVGAAGLQPAYLRAVAAAGGAPVLLAPSGAEATRTILERLDGIIFPGGPDLEPLTYGAPRHDKTRTNPDLDRFELPVARWAVQSDIPVLGICRGLQLLNVALGGSLVQHLDRHDGPWWHRRHSHGLWVRSDSRLAAILGCTELEVNSFHHQAVDRPGHGLEPVAWAHDGTIEALEGSEHTWLICVQFHPEELASKHAPSQRLFEAFVEACRQRAAAGKRPCVDLARG